MPNDYVNLKNLQGVEIKPITDLAAINLTEVNGIAVEGNTIGIQDGYIESAYYTEMVDPTVGPAASSSAYVEGGTIYTLLGGYAVTSAINTASPSQQKVPSEAAVVSAFDDIVVSGASYYAGTGINIDAGHTVSVANVPTSAVAGLDTQLTGISASVAGKQDAISAGYRMELSGTTLSQARYFPIESPTSATITLQAGHAYKIQATTGSKTLTAETIPANQFGLEGHAEIFVANTGLIKTTSSVVLADALEPDAVNNCTVRFHDHKAIISVEDHVAGHIVTVSAGTVANSLYYWLTQPNTAGDAATQYVGFDATLNGTPVNFEGASNTAVKHVVGNGYMQTILTGNVAPAAALTVSDLGLQNVTVTGGTLTLGDAYIPGGATVAVNGGGLAVEKVTGNGGVIDLGGTNVTMTSGVARASGCTFTSGIAGSGGAWKIENTSAYAENCTFIGNSASSTGGGAIRIESNGYASIMGCIVSGNRCYNAPGGGGIAIAGSGVVDIDSSVVSGNIDRNNGRTDILANNTTQINVIGSTIGTTEMRGGSVSMALASQCKITAIGGGSGGGCLTISSGAILDLPGNTITTPINPGGGVTIQGGCTIVTSGGSSVVVDCTGGSVAIGSIGNTGALSVPPSASRIDPRTDCTITGATVPAIGVFYNNTVTLSNCVIGGYLGPSRVGGDHGTAVLGGTCSLVNGTEIIGNDTLSPYLGTAQFEDGTTLDITSGNTWNVLRFLGTVIVGANVTFVKNGNVIPVSSGTYQQVASINTSGVINLAE